MNVALSDPGAVADLTASLAEAAAAHVAEVAKRVPGARLVVQFDEPALPVGGGGRGADRERAVAAGRDRGRHGAGAAEPGARRRPRVHGRALLCYHGPVRDNQGGRSGRGSPSTSASYGGGKRTKSPSPRRRGWGC